MNLVSEVGDAISSGAHQENFRGYLRVPDPYAIGHRFPSAASRLHPAQPPLFRRPVSAASLSLLLSYRYPFESLSSNSSPTAAGSSTSPVTCFMTSDHSALPPN